jgi:hypothetical protein
MKLSANEDLAMILPIPVPPKTREKAVRFINLKRYSDFFSAMQSGFPSPEMPAYGGKIGSGAVIKLDVVDVGAFEASFVPSINDFERLDERFRLPTGTWEKLPRYKDYGFAVFKLKEKAITTHPMAFDFPRADRTKLFFPTVHIHDGDVHEVAEFDHTLYAQFDPDHRFNINDWTESMQPAGMFMEIRRCAGVVDDNSHVYMQQLSGEQENKDIIV